MQTNNTTKILNNVFVLFQLQFGNNFREGRVPTTKHKISLRNNRLEGTNKGRISHKRYNIFRHIQSYKIIPCPMLVIGS